MRVNGAMAPGNVVAEAAVSGEHLTASLLGRPVGRLGLACCHVLQSPFHVEYLSAACSVTAWHAADVTVRNGNGRLLRAGRACDAGRPWLVPGFVRKQEVATAAVASIEDAAECGERADTLVSGLLSRLMRQQRTVAAALDYIRPLERDTP